MSVMARDNEVAAAFGAKLREMRGKACLTQAALAELAGLQANALARIERGEREPMWSSVLKLAAALGVEPNDFRPAGE